MEPLRIKDNSRIEKAEFLNIPALTARIADKTLGQLEKDGIFVFPERLRKAEDLTEDQMLLSSADDCYRTSNIVGFLGCGEERLVIASRFSQKNQDYFFQYLLERVMKVPHFTAFETDVNQDNRIFNLLVFLFPHYLRSAMRKGIFKTYVRRNYNDGHVRGTIQIARHIAENTPFLGKIAYTQREYSADNDLTQLIRHTIEAIKSKCYGAQILAKVKDQVREIVNATQRYEPCDRARIMAANKKNPAGHAYYREYRALQHLCLLILQHQLHQLGTGSRQVYGVLFDAAWLWEEYINLLLSDRFYHPMNKGGKDGQYLFDRSRGLIYPDFLSRDAAERTVADAKYKPVEHIGNRDYLQVLAYMLRFDARRGLYLYPESGDTDQLLLQVNSGSSYENNVAPRSDLSVVKCGLHIPQNAKSYLQFKHEIGMEEKQFCCKIN